MSKKRQIKKRAKKQREPKPQHSGEMYKTTRGVWIECLPVQLLYETMTSNIAASIEWPDAPERVTIGAGGVEVAEDITQEYIDGAYATEEEKQEWLHYQDEFEAAKATFDEKLTDAAAKFLATEGIRLADESLLEKWKERDEFLGMVVPDGPREQMEHFLQTRILGNGQIDGREIMLRIFRASGYDKEVLDTIERTFQSQMGGRDGDTITGSARDNGVSAEEQQEIVMVGEPKLHDGESTGECGLDLGSVADDDTTGAELRGSVLPDENDARGVGSART